MIRIEKYKKTNNWAVWIDERLVAVVCYKKGAQAIKDLITQLKRSAKANLPRRTHPKQRLKKKPFLYFNRK